MSSLHDALQIVSLIKDSEEFEKRIKDLQEATSMFHETLVTVGNGQAALAQKEQELEALGVSLEAKKAELDKTKAVLEAETARQVEQYNQKQQELKDWAASLETKDKELKNKEFELADVWREVMEQRKVTEQYDKAVQEREQALQNKVARLESFLK